MGFCEKSLQARLQARCQIQWLVGMSIDRSIYVLNISKEFIKTRIQITRSWEEFLICQLEKMD